MPTLRLLAASLAASALVLPAIGQSHPATTPAPLAATITSPTLFALDTTPAHTSLGAAYVLHPQTLQGRPQIRPHLRRQTLQTLQGRRGRQQAPSNQPSRPRKSGSWPQRPPPTRPTAPRPHGPDPNRLRHPPQLQLHQARPQVRKPHPLQRNRLHPPLQSPHTRPAGHNRQVASRLVPPVPRHPKVAVTKQLSPTGPNQQRPAEVSILRSISIP